jgi:hypothetical protein
MTVEIVQSHVFSPIDAKAVSRESVVISVISVTLICTESSHAELAAYDTVMRSSI